MNNYKSHEEQILDYFREFKTVTSQQLRDTFHFADVRKPVSNLHKRGLVKKIGRKGNIAIYQLCEASNPILSPKKWVFDGDTARLVDDKPEQLSI